MKEPAPSLHSTLLRLRAAQARDPLPSWDVRATRLRTLEKLLTEQRGSFAEAISADFGHRPVEETELLELYPSLSNLRHTLKRGRRWMRPRRGLANLVFLPARTTLLPQPRGVVGIIVPWNYPLYLAVGPLIDALAAGNRVMLKMSEYTPGFSALFAELVARYFKPDEVVVVTGDAEVAPPAGDARGVHLRQQALGVHHHAVPDDARGALVQNAGGDEVERELFVAINHPVAGVATALVAHDIIGPRAQFVHDLALALVAPLRADHRDDRHPAHPRFRRLCATYSIFHTPWTDDHGSR